MTNNTVLVKTSTLLETDRFDGVLFAIADTRNRREGAAASTDQGNSHIGCKEMLNRYHRGAPYSTIGEPR